MLDLLLKILPKIIKLLLFALIALLKAAFSAETWYLDVLIYTLLAYAFFDVLIVIGNEVNEYRKQKRLREAEAITAEDRKAAAKDRKENEKFRKEFKKKEKAGRLLSTLIHESLIKESDILAVAKTAEYYQLVVYSAGYSKILNASERTSLTDNQAKELNAINRKYPELLKEIGFVRIGTISSTTFVINKRYLPNKLRDVAPFKKYLMVQLENVRKEEWQRFLEVLKSFRGTNQHLYAKYKNNFSDDYLPINFLLTASIMSPRNIGFVRNKHIGLAPVTSNEEFSVQLLAGTKVRDIKLLKENKIQIRNFFKKTDIVFLLGQMEEGIRKKIVRHEQAIKKKFEIEYILDFAEINEKDLQKYLVSLGINQNGIAKTITNRARQYKSALRDMNIGLN